MRFLVRVHFYGGFLCLLLGSLLMLIVGLNQLKAESWYWLRSAFDTQSGLSFTSNDPKIPLGFLPSSKTFSLLISKIKLDALVTSQAGLTDLNSMESALENGIVHIAGTALPNESGTGVYFGHSIQEDLFSWKSNSPFTLLYKLNHNDIIELVYKGNVYRYKVIDRYISDPDDLTYLNNALSKQGQKIILVTCYPPGSIAKRLVIEAQIGSLGE